MKLSEAIEEYGACLAIDSEMGIAVTMNASYYNVWVNRDDDNWDNIQAYAQGEDDPYKMKYKDVEKRAEEILEDTLSDDEEEDDDY
jgi:hypothetical protein